MCVQKFRFGPRESKKAMVYSDVGRLNCNVSYTTFASPTLGQVTPNSAQFRVSLFHQISYPLWYFRELITKSTQQCFTKRWKV